MNTGSSRRSLVEAGLQAPPAAEVEAAPARPLALPWAPSTPEKGVAHAPPSPLVSELNPPGDTEQRAPPTAKVGAVPACPSALTSDLNPRTAMGLWSSASAEAEVRLLSVFPSASRFVHPEIMTSFSG